MPFSGEALGCPVLLRGVLLPYPQLTSYVQFRKQTQWQVQTGRDGMKMVEVRSSWEVILKAEGQGQTRPRGHQGKCGTGWQPKDLVSNFLASIMVPPLHPLSQGICGLPSLGRAAIATATGFPESLHCSSISGCVGQLPQALHPSPNHS